MCEDDTGSVGNISPLYKCLMEGVQMLCLRRTLWVEHEYDAVGISHHGGPAALVLV